LLVLKPYKDYDLLILLYVCADCRIKSQNILLAITASQVSASCWNKALRRNEDNLKVLAHAADTRARNACVYETRVLFRTHLRTSSVYCVQAGCRRCQHVITDTHRLFCSFSRGVSKKTNWNKRKL